MAHAPKLGFAPLLRGWRELRDGLAVPCDHDLLARLDSADEPSEPIPCFRDVYVHILIIAIINSHYVGLASPR